MDKLFSDEQLIAFFVAGNIEAWDIFFEIYRVHSIKLASESEKIYRGSGLTFDDFYSICLESIQVALNKYQLYSCTFYSYWRSICLKQISAFVKEYSYIAKESVDLNSLSLDDIAFEGSKTKYEEVIGEVDNNISKSVYTRELFEYIYQKLELLSVKERQFLFLIVDGYDMESIEVMMGLQGKQYYSLRRAIKKKLDIELIKEYFN